MICTSFRIFCQKNYFYKNLIFGKSNPFVKRNIFEVVSLVLKEKVKAYYKFMRHTTISKQAKK